MGSSTCCSCKNSKEIRDYNSKNERALIEYRSNSAERYEHDYKVSGKKKKNFKKEMTTYQALQAAKKRVSTS